jgi:hypothetical protein
MIGTRVHRITLPFSGPLGYGRSSDQSPTASCSWDLNPHRQIQYPVKCSIRIRSSGT